MLVRGRQFPTKNLLVVYFLFSKYQYPTDYSEDYQRKQTGNHNVQICILKTKKIRILIHSFSAG